MPVSKNRQFAKIASDVNTSGTLTAAAISSDVTLGGATIYASRSNLPSSGNTAGDQAFTTDTNRLYIWNGSGWYNIALLNVAPAISSVTDSDGGTTPFALSAEGAVTTITITAADSDGDPITYTASADSNFSGLATLSQAANVFTVTPLSQDSATTELGTITFTATDGINVASSGVQTFRLRFVSQYWDEAVISLNTSSTNTQDNTILVDRSSNARTITNSGTPIQTEFHPYYDYWSYHFPNGSNQWISIPASSDFNFGAGDFTIECWYRHEPKTVADTDRRYIIHTENASWSGYKWIIYAGFDSNNIEFYTYADYASNGSQPTLTSSSTLEAGKWYHIAVVRNNLTLSLYMNGVLEARSSSYTGNIGDATNIVQVGGGAYSITDRGLAGKVHDLRIVKGTAVYTGGSSVGDNVFSVPSSLLTAIPNTVLLTARSNQFKDLSSSGHTISEGGGAKISTGNPWGQDSEFLPAQNKGSIYSATKNANNATFTSSSALAADFTIEGWFYAESVDGSYTTLWSNGGTSHNSRIILSIGDAGLYHRLYISTLQRPSTSFTNGWMISTNKYALVGRWNHIAIVRDVGKIYFYLNGVKQYMAEWTSQSYVLEYITNTTAMDGNFNVGGLQGWTSDFKVTSSAVYTSNFTLPTAPVGSANADTYLPFDNPDIYDITGNSSSIVVGRPTTSTAQTKYANASMYFDGSDYIRVNNVANVGYNDFTAECWLYSVSGNDKGIIETRSSATGTDGFTLTTFDDGTIRVWSNGALVSTSGLTYRNTWVHVAVVRNSGTWQLFINGTSIGTNTTSINLTNPTMYIGAGTYASGSTVDAFLNGYIEDFQFLVGVAKYTANFTPPTQTQNRSYQAES